MIRIELLKNHLFHVPTLADIWRDGLGRTWIPSITVDEVRSWMLLWKHDNRLPVAHIALDDDQPIGVCALQQNDGIKSDLFPWLTDLCVDKNFQKLGVGGRLIEATKLKAQRLGFERLYLFTFDRNLVPYYHRFGFTIMGSEYYRGYPVTIMKASLPQ